jgi:hypothetical protein
MELVSMLVSALTAAVVAVIAAALVYRAAWKRTLEDVALKVGCADLDATVERAYLEELKEVHRLYREDTPDAAYERLDQFLRGLGEISSSPDEEL